METLKGYRTLIFQAVAFALMILASTTGVDIPGEYGEQIALGIYALANVVLRFKTTTPVGQK